VFIRVDSEWVALSNAIVNGEKDLRLWNKAGQQRWVRTSRQRGSLKPTKNGDIVMSDGDFSRIEPRSNFSRSPILPWNGEGPTPTWDVAFSGYNEIFLVDSGGLRSTRKALDREALQLPDPGYSEVTDATLLPGRSEVVLNIVRCQHVAIFDFANGNTRLVRLAGRYGSKSVALLGDDLWMTNYDLLCVLNVATRAFRASPVLQPPHPDPQYGLMTNAFIGEPAFVPHLKSWLVPRPYNADVLLVSVDSLLPTMRIACGGTPYEIAVFDGGDLLILDHPDGSIRTANLSDLKPI
jgi:hypothetical protein